ncbi:MAG: hypothetical protein ACLRPQ_00035 [Streptococcus sp.]
MKKRKKIILGSITGALALALAGGGFGLIKPLFHKKRRLTRMLR